MSMAYEDIIKKGFVDSYAYESKQYQYLNTNQWPRLNGQYSHDFNGKAQGKR